MLPLHVISIVPLYLLALKINPDMGFIKLFLGIGFVISETLLTDILRQYQIRSDYTRHIVTGAIKSIGLFCILLTLVLLSEKISFEDFLLINLIINLCIIFSSDYVKSIKLSFGISYINSDLLKISFPYFLMYFVDKYLISFDRSLFSNNLSSAEYGQFILILPIWLAAFNLIEGSFFLKAYNDVFTGKLRFKSFLKFSLFLSLLSIPLSVLIHFYLLNLKQIEFGILHLIIPSFLFILLSSVGWYLNLMNYRIKSSSQFLLISITLGLIYLFLIKTYFIINHIDILILMLLLPVSSVIANLIFKKGIRL